MKPQTSLTRHIQKVFENKPDKAGILQGVRTLRRGQPHLRTFLFPSRKSGGHIPCEGSFEKEAALCFELDPTIDEFRGQPFRMDGPHGGSIVPDFALRRGHLYAVVDVKPKGQLSRPRTQERMQWTRRELGAIGIPHFLITEEELHKQYRTQIRHKLRHGLSVKLGNYHASQLLEAVGTETSTVMALRQQALALNLSPFAVEKLAVMGRLIFPINAPWRETTLLGVYNNEQHRTVTENWGSVQDLRLLL